MKTNINLIEGVGSTKVDSYKITFLLQRIAGIFGLIFLVLGLILGGIIFFKINSINSLNSRNNELKDQITALEPVEQQFVLVRDRATKVKTALADLKSQNNLSLFNSVTDNFPSSVNIGEAKIQSDSISISFSTALSSDLVGIFTFLASDERFSEIKLENFSFSPTSGYLADLKMVSK